MTDLQGLWAALLGAVLPLLIAVVEQPRWSKPQRTAASVAICLIAGAAQAWIDGSIGSGQSVASILMVVLLSAQTFYRTVWKPAGVAGSIERGTSPKG